MWQNCARRFPTWAILWKLWKQLAWDKSILDCPRLHAIPYTNQILYDQVNIWSSEYLQESEADRKNQAITRTAEPSIEISLPQLLPRPSPTGKFSLAHTWRSHKLYRFSVGLVLTRSYHRRLRPTDYDSRLRLHRVGVVEKRENYRRLAYSSGDVFLSTHVWASRLSSVYFLCEAAATSSSLTRNLSFLWLVQQSAVKSLCNVIRSISWLWLTTLSIRLGVFDLLNKAWGS